MLCWEKMESTGIRVEGFLCSSFLGSSTYCAVSHHRHCHELNVEAGYKDNDIYIKKCVG